MILTETYALSNGVSIPKLGLGAWRIDDSKGAEVVREAVEIGYRHIDTAQAYGNERGVGEGLCDDRQGVFNRGVGRRFRQGHRGVGSRLFPDARVTGPEFGRKDGVAG